VAFGDNLTVTRWWLEVSGGAEAKTWGLLVPASVRSNIPSKVGCYHHIWISYHIQYMVRSWEIWVTVSLVLNTWASARNHHEEPENAALQYIAIDFGYAESRLACVIVVECYVPGMLTYLHPLLNS
jgi:hypothetical protein